MITIDNNNNPTAKQIQSPSPTSSTSSSSSSSILYNSNIIIDSNGQYNSLNTSHSSTNDTDKSANSCTSSTIPSVNFLANGSGGGLVNSQSSSSVCCDMDLNASYNEFMQKTNLIVNYLPQNMDQEEIKRLFSSVGHIDTCKLIKDKLSEGQSLGYAFINYGKPDDASEAINKFNGMRLQNKIIKVSYARPSSDTIKGANLYVCGLRLDVTQPELENMFNQFGTIISSKILTDPKTGVSKGVGFVRFDQRMEAEVAIAKLNGQIPESNTEPLIVKFANSPATGKSVVGLPLAPFVPTCRGFYQPFRTSTNSSYRYSPLSTYCAPETTLYQTHSASSTGLTTPASVISVSSMLSAPMGTTAIPTVAPTTSISSTSISSTAGSIYSGWCIFVYNLGPETDENTLWQLFGPFGAVQSVKIIRDAQTMKCKGFGFITMTNYEEAISAINCLNGYNMGNRILQVSFKTNHKQIY